ncbi:MAG: hypothetical protein HZC54_13460 [Verrucomicrobia bacterium]|nr:hypothetical protein [Verrucomicrobiota bacterium]
MKTAHLLLVALLAGFAAHAPGQTPPKLSPQSVAVLRGVAQEAERNCVTFYDKLRWVQMRTADQSKALGAALRLRDAARKFAGATTSERWPRPDWLRYCSERLLNAWVEEEQFFPTLEAPPAILELWAVTQASLVALYKTAEPIMGRPMGVPLPQALSAAAPRPAKQP